MSNLQIHRSRSAPVGPYNLAHYSIRAPSPSFSKESLALAERLMSLKAPTPTLAGGEKSTDSKTTEEKLYDTLAAFKIRTAAVAMYLDQNWRTRLFGQLDSLLSAEDWQPEDLPPTVASFSTFIRMLLNLKPSRRPGLGATGDGHLIAAWTVGTDRLTIECLPDDTVRWLIAVTIDGDRETAAGKAQVARLVDVLSPYQPTRWFEVGDNIRST